MWVNVFVVRMDYKLLLYQHFQIKAGVENNNWASEDFQPEAPAMICVLRPTQVPFAVDLWQAKVDNLWVNQ